MIALILPLLFLVTLPLGREGSESGSAELRRAADLAIHQGVSADFLNHVIAARDAGFVEKAVRINVTNYAFTPDYSGHYNSESVGKVQAFLQEHDSLFNAIERKRMVPKEVIASILWIESRCGTITGTYHVPSVYLSLVLANDPVYVNASMDRVLNNADFSPSQHDSLRAVIAKRAARKAAWAIKELKSLQTIHERGLMNVSELKGSWAGAFGFPQFIPSSYTAWAVDGNADRIIDLYSLVDAAHSIANYLRNNGWTASRSKQRKAVHHYNNSDAYVNAVFTLAEKVRS